jgi:ABC-type molybdate transport system substrate-binding protein
MTGLCGGCPIPAAPPGRDGVSGTPDAGGTMNENPNTAVTVFAAGAMLAFLVWLAAQMAITPENATTLMAIGAVTVAGAIAMIAGLAGRRGDRGPG